LVKYRQAAVMTDEWRLVYPGQGDDPDAVELYDIAKDPGQKSDLAAQKPDVVARLKADYETWWTQASQRADEVARIVLGHRAENPVRLTSHDWHSDGSLETWNQRGIRQAPAVNGHWTVEVERAGRYRVELRRWPVEVDLPITAPYKDKHFNREDAAGAAIDAVEARLEVGEIAVSTPIRPDDKAAVFTLKLPQGPANLKATFVGGDGTERGAYYVYVHKP
jgi:hypothetical protein